MIKNEIKLYKNIVEVYITDFWEKRETLYWEWTKDEFLQKYKTLKAITFGLHWGRVVSMDCVQWFDNARANNFTLELKINSLDEMDQEKVKGLVKKYKSDFKKYPTDARINNVIDFILFPEKKQQEEIKQLQFWDRIRELKQKRVEFFENLSEEKKDKLINFAWDKLFKDHPDFNENRNNLRARSYFFVYYNQIIDNLIIKNKS